MVSKWKSRDYIPKAEYLERIASFFDTSVDVLLGSSDNIISPGIMTIPLIEQNFSCGRGESWLEEVEVRKVSVMERLASGQPVSSLIAAIIKGDSMEGASLYDGDMVVFSKGLISGNGIYAIAIDGDLYVKRLAWNPITKIVSVISENPAYDTYEVRMDDERLTILGKVTGWLHTNR